MRGDGVGVGDIGEVLCDAWFTRNPAGGDDGGGAGREQDAGMVSCCWCTERDASTEPTGDRLGVGDGARCGHGACAAHGTGSGGIHGMRGDGLGVGDIGEVQGDARSPGDAAASDDGGGAGREQDAGVVGGREGIERDASTEPSGDRVGVGDGARGRHGARDVLRTGSAGADGMRGDGVGVGDIGEMQLDERSPGDVAGGDDGGDAGGKQDAGVVGGRGGIERGASTERCGHRLVVGHCAWGEHWVCDEFGTGSAWAHCM
jgi:hypothetical protein